MQRSKYHGARLHQFSRYMQFIVMPDLPVCLGRTYNGDIPWEGDRVARKEVMKNHGKCEMTFENQLKRALTF